MKLKSESSAKLKAAGLTFSTFKEDQGYGVRGGISSSPFTHLVLGELSVSNCQGIGGAEEEGRLVENMILFQATFFKLNVATKYCDLLDTENWGFATKKI